MAYNFVGCARPRHRPIILTLQQTIRKPRQANEWLLWYFGSKDIGVAHTLSRTFFWSENVIWKEDLVAHQCVVFLAERDSIINSGKVWRYLKGGDGVGKEKKNGEEAAFELEKEKKRVEVEDPEAPLRAVWCADMDHGQVFDLAGWRARLKGEVLREAKRGGSPEIMG